MTKGDNFCLRFNSFDSSVRTFWQRFQVETDFCDMTLACEDKQIKTHKVIISSFSPVLSSILKLNHNLHPLIYLRRVKFRNLQNLLNFMYQGEVNIAEEDVASFLELAEDLLITGLSEQNMKVEGNDSGDTKYLQNDHQNVVTSPKVKRTDENVQIINDTHFDESLTNYLEKNDNIDHYAGFAVENNEEDYLGDAKYLQNDHQNDVTSPKVKRTDENVQSINDTHFDNIDHYAGFAVEKNEDKQEIIIEISKQSLLPVDGHKQFICEICEKEFGYRHVFVRHIKSSHEGVRYPCNQCEHKATTKSHLKRHVSNIHI